MVGRSSSDIGAFAWFWPGLSGLVTCLRAGQGVAEYADDSSISNSIRARFSEDPVVHFGDVGVTTLNGNVRRYGQVNSERERQRAAQIARGVKGVRSANNEVVVR